MENKGEWQGKKKKKRRGGRQGGGRHRPSRVAINPAGERAALRYVRRPDPGRCSPCPPLPGTPRYQGPRGWGSRSCCASSSCCWPASCPPPARGQVSSPSARFSLPFPSVPPRPSAGRPGRQVPLTRSRSPAPRKQPGRWGGCEGAGPRRGDGTGRAFCNRGPPDSLCLLLPQPTWPCAGSSTGTAAPTGAACRCTPGCPSPEPPGRARAR